MLMGGWKHDKNG
ncbi:unnamed protein product [Tuber melanosporum]|uniref:(Perigord truffle) hypothetical protein n=1 Tax=Tuber melanosporum (strain Mel28) TaxID=656061 RepID=D5GGE3_TUBMM|nr:unnamed protein product [Tuber melanosporum]